MEITPAQLMLNLTWREAVDQIIEVLQTFDEHTSLEVTLPSERPEVEAFLKAAREAVAALEGYRN
jgi:hypothetical protein